MVGLAPKVARNRYFARILLSMRSFGELKEDRLALVKANRLRVVLADTGEDVTRLGDRTGSILDPATTALLNGLFGNEVFEGGELLKVVVREELAPRP